MTPHRSALGSPCKASELYFKISKKLKIGRAGGGRDGGRSLIIRFQKSSLAHVSTLQNHYEAAFASCFGMFPIPIRDEKAYLDQWYIQNCTKAYRLIHINHIVLYISGGSSNRATEQSNARPVERTIERSSD